MLIENWPTAFVIIVGMVTIAISVTSILTTIVNKDKPLARHCTRCQQKIADECRRNEFEPDE